MRVAVVTFVLLSCTGTLAMVSGASDAVAQDFYVGTAYEATSGRFETGTTVENPSDLSTVQALAGARFQIGSLGFLGGEFETSLDQGQNSGSTDPTTLNRLQRIRAVAGTRVGPATVFASVGQASYDLNDAAQSDTLAGTTYGIGGEFSVGKNLTIRAEAIHDSVDGGALDYRIDSTSIRAGAVINF